MTFPLLCPVCSAHVCDFEGGESPSVQAIAAHFEQGHGLSRLLAGGIAQSIVFHLYGLVTHEELSEIFRLVVGAGFSPAITRMTATAHQD